MEIARDEEKEDRLNRESSDRHCLDKTLRPVSGLRGKRGKGVSAERELRGGLNVLGFKLFKSKKIKTRIMAFCFSCKGLVKGRRFSERGARTF